ncbi:MAG TPA: SMC-Scp complex subunit ScpB [Terriglobales bacterium]|jgi:segregation and condensation protein B|nr:SMC-Scp complex subunit ScpB [Terriglobales bacterium]
MAIKGQIEAIIYAAEEPVTADQIALVLKESVIAEHLLADAGLEGSALDAEVKMRVRAAIEELTADYANSDRGMEVRQVAGGYRMGTKPEHHDVVRHFAKNLKPPVRLSMPALETLAVIAYKQPVTAPEISEIRGVDCSGVLATLIDRKLITTAGRKQVIGRPILYKTSKEFLLRFGLKDVSELPSLEEFEKLAGDGQGGLFVEATPPESQSSEAASIPDPREPADNVQAEDENVEQPATHEHQS